MVVLVVDDQINVVNGIVFGVNWEKIGVSKVLKAFNSYEAKEILSTEKVDIMLCDIEMPMENGIALYKWTKEQNLCLECIFLTAHPDFFYAKEALQLGGFDYILQPARYDDIEHSILKAINSLNAKKEMIKYSSYGQLMYYSRDRILQSLLSQWYQGNSVDMQSFLKDFEKFNLPLKADTFVYFVRFHILRIGEELQDWDQPTLIYALTNIVSELFHPYAQRTLLAQTQDRHFAFLIYPDGKFTMDINAVVRQLRQFIASMKEYFLSDIACYTGNKIRVEQVTQMCQDLKKLERDNVNYTAQVFLLESNGCSSNENADSQEMWNKFIANSDTACIFQQVAAYLDELSASLQLDSKGLKFFYQNFMNLVSRLCELHHISVHELFEDEDLLEKSLNAYICVPNMHMFIDEMDQYFKQLTMSKLELQKQTEAIIQYIKENIENDIRRTDIAEAVYLTPNYISRLFKTQMHISLKQYITNEKMKLAQTLIRTTKLPISVIALKVGYTNFSHFSQVYKKVNQISPTLDRQTSNG